MDDVLFSQSNATRIATVLIGTAAMFTCVSQFDTARLVPSKLYNCRYVREPIRYSLEHEMISTDFTDIEKDQLVPMPTIKKVRVKFKHPTPLEFVSVEDSRGFIK